MHNLLPTESIVALGEVAAGGEIQTHDAVVGLEQCSVGGEVGRRTRVGLDVDAPPGGIEMEGLEGAGTTQVGETYGGRRERTSRLRRTTEEERFRLDWRRLRWLAAASRVEVWTCDEDEPLPGLPVSERADGIGEAVARWLELTKQWRGRGAVAGLAEGFSR
ncbi:hypothetical protein LR48_Vigan05g142200 [Vigna angularis]|uniref:Uncharacterized protein n=1 Tax=Phaseolus angularis TaxID=3914 RepID=A0A0L9UMK9_PHAAN|nr:hypothetical protein LR48_Vigan05g142200 [Vigna angularis]